MDSRFRDSLLLAVRLSALVLVISQWDVRSAEATSVYYFDQEVKSGNGAWRVTAKSADNLGQKPKPAASRFRLEMVNALTGRPVWAWEQTEEDAPPVNIHVHDSGVTVVWNACDELFVVSAKGEVNRVLEFDDVVTDEERERWIHRTTAGDSWSGLSFWYFCPVGDELYFVIRTYWDRRIVANVARLGPVLESPDLASEFDRRERHLALKTLKLAAENEFIAPKDQSLDWDVIVAAYVAGKHKIRESIPLLHQMDSAATHSGTSFRLDKNLTVNVNEPRAIAQLSLRRLGATPAGYPATFMKFEGTEETWDEPWRVQGKARLSNLKAVREGLSRKELVAAIGHPDNARDWYLKDLERGEDAWEYDIDSDPPKTLRVVFRNGRVQKFVTVDPLWTTTGIRDECLAH